MASYQGTIDPTKINLLVNFIPVVGFADGDFITIERNADVFTNYVGSHSDISRIKNPDTSYSITVVVQQNSPADTALQAYLTTDTFVGVPPVLAISLNDEYGQMLFQSSRSWITTEPTRAFTNGMATREWTFYSQNGVWAPNPNAGGLDSVI